MILIISITSLQFSRLQQLKSDVEKVDNTNPWIQNTAEQQLDILRLLPKFGYKNIFADWTFLNFLQYFGDSNLRQKIGYSLSANYFEVIIDSDPYFIESYEFLVNSISIYAGQPQKTISLLEKGLETMTPNVPQHSYLLWRHKGTDELLFLGDTQSAQKSYEMAANWAEQSSAEDSFSVAALSRQTAKFLEAAPNSNPAQISAWSEV